jgi:hypothetical protein
MPFPQYKTLGDVLKTYNIPQLSNDQFTFFKDRFDINDLKKLYNALSSIMELCKIQF